MIASELSKVLADHSEYSCQRFVYIGMRSVIHGSSIALLLLSGCAPGPSMSYTVHISPSFAPQEQEWIVSAVDDWMWKVRGLQLHASIADCDGGDNEICFHPVTGYTTFCGYTQPHDSGYQDIRMYEDAPGWTVPYYQAIAAHELGHALGLHHTGKGTLMYPDRDALGALTVQPADVEQFWEVRR